MGIVVAGVCAGLVLAKKYNSEDRDDGNIIIAIIFILLFVWLMTSDDIAMFLLDKIN